MDRIYQDSIFFCSLTPHVTELERDNLGKTEADTGRALAHVDRSIESYIARCRERIPSFVESHFSLEHTWRLQKRTLWRDLACAPVNSAWALPYLVVQKTSEAMERVGYSRLAQWATHLPSGIKTGYQLEIERLICASLLEWDRQQSSSALPQGFLKELDAVPSLRKLIESPDLEKSVGKSARVLEDLLRQFSLGRAIVSDASGTLLTLAASWSSFGGTTLSLNGIATAIAKKNAHDRAASRFFLGEKLGSHFYDVFPPAVREGNVRAIVFFLVVGLTVGTMACTILSDPIRKTLGFHRNRLEALIDGMEKELIVHCHKKIRRSGETAARMG